MSDQWFEALAGKVRASAARQLPETSSERALGLGIRVTEVPWAADGQFAYTVVVGGRPDVVVGSDEGADVVLVGSYGAARALAEGTRAVGDLLEAGDLRIRGSVETLMSSAELLSVLAGGAGEDAGGLAGGTPEVPDGGGHRTD